MQISTEPTEAFADEALVACPRCNACARVAPEELPAQTWFAPRRLTCTSCGHTARWAPEGAERRIVRHWGEPPVDDYFGLPLWIQGPCCGHVLWAYNWRHLDAIAEFVAAKHRERSRDPKFGWSRYAMAGRLPRWMKEAGNRERIAACIEHLRRDAGLR